MSDVIKPDTTVKVELRGGAFDCCIVTLCKELDEIGAQATRENLTHYDYLDRVAAHVEQKHNVRPELGEADHLVTVAGEVWKQKKSGWRSGTSARPS